MFFPTYASLQDDRTQLSKACFRAASFMIRSGSLFALVLVLVIPEFVRTSLGTKWSPMVMTFRLMVVYTLLDPPVITSGNLLIAVGRPRTVTRINAFQLAIFVPAVLILAHFFGIEGIALAADLMLVTALALIIPKVRDFVGFPLCKMVGYPVLGLALGGGTALLIQRYCPLASDWVALLVKSGTAAIMYAALLTGAEYEGLRKGLAIVRSALRRTHSAAE